MGYFVIFYPILFVKQKKYLTDEEYKKFSKCFLLTYVLGIFFLILLLLVSIYCYNPFNLGLGFLITSSCFIIPVLFGLLVLFGDTKKFVKPIIISLMGVLGLLFLYGVVSSLYLVSIGSSETYYIEQPYNNIKIELDTFDINIHLSENFENKIVSKENKKLYIEEKVIDNVLTIRQIDNRMFFEKFFDFNNFEVDLYLSQQSINLLNIECSTSDITIHDGFTFNNVVISNSTGDIKMYSDSVQAIQIESSTGDVEFYDVKCDTLDIELSTGNTKLTNVVLKNDFYFESSTGNLFLDGFDAANMYIVSSTGDVKGTILSSKFFVATSSTGDVTVPKTREGGECRITVSTGDIKIEYK